MKYDLRDTTFLIPIRLDSIVRLENLILTIDCICNSFNTNIFILEASSYSNNFISNLLSDITYCFVEDKDPIFHRTKYLNEMTRRVNTDIISIWDSDIILEASQIIDSVRHLRDKDYNVAYPYNGFFLDTSDILRKHYWKFRNIEFLKKNRGRMMPLYSADSIGAVGGAIFLRRQDYINSGMENEDFYGWGMEDGERYYRWLELDYKIYRSDGCMFHLSHPRDINGAFRSINHARKAMNDFIEITNYNKEELRRKFITQP